VEDGYINNMSRTFGDRLAKTGLARRRFHDLRHACASLLMAQGVPPSTVMEILGHSQPGHHHAHLPRSEHAGDGWGGRGYGPAARGRL